jgi:Lipocalin-like domain
MRRIIVACALAGVLAVPAKAQSLKDQLVGAWTLVSCSNQPWCLTPNGIYILDGSGHYAIVNAARGRPKFTVTKPGQPRDAYSAEDYKAATMGVQTQFGTWSASERDNTIAFHIDGALFPNVEGLNGQFTVRVSGDALTLIGGNDSPSVWRRVKN